MQYGFIKGLKPKFIKQIALLMSICYLINPLQNQIIEVLHSLSHSLEIPSSIFTHENKSITAFESHESHSHDNRVSEHEHELIDLVDLILDGSSEDKDSEDAPLKEFKVKKHLVAYSLKLPFKFFVNSSKTTFFYHPKLKDGHPQIISLPPQSS